MFIRIRKTHVFTVERPSKRSIPLITPSQVSWSDLAGHLVVAHVLAGDSEQRRAERVDELREHRFVAIAEALHKGPLLGALLGPGFHGANLSPRW